MAAKTIEGYIASLRTEQGAIVQALVGLTRTAAPQAEAAIKWSQPVFSSNGPAVFIKAASQHVTYGFWRGAELDDPKRLLEGSGVTRRRVKVTSLSDIPNAQLTRWVEQAVRSNEAKGDPTRS